MPPCLLDGKPEDWEPSQRAGIQLGEFANPVLDILRFFLSFLILYYPLSPYSQRRAAMAVYARAGGIASHPEEVSRSRARVDVPEISFSRLFFHSRRRRAFKVPRRPLASPLCLWPRGGAWAQTAAWVQPWSAAGSASSCQRLWSRAPSSMTAVTATMMASIITMVGHESFPQCQLLPGIFFH